MRVITRYHAENGGLLTEADMAGYQVQVTPPLSTRFGDADLLSCGFWCQGPALLQAANIVSGLDLAGMGHNAVPYIHHVAETLKLCSRIASGSTATRISSTCRANGCCRTAMPRNAGP